MISAAEIDYLVNILGYQSHVYSEECGWCYNGGFCDFVSDRPANGSFHQCSCAPGFYGSHCQGREHKTCINSTSPSIRDIIMVFVNVINSIICSENTTMWNWWWLHQWRNVSGGLHGWTHVLRKLPSRVYWTPLWLWVSLCVRYLALQSELNHKCNKNAFQ